MDLNINRTLSVPCSVLFKSWTDPEVIQRWFSPSGKWSMSIVRMDVHVGGKYHYNLHSPEGENWVVSGEYKEIIPNERLVFTWTTPDVKDTLVSVRFKDLGSSTQIEIVHDLLPNKEQVDEHTWGWNACMDNLASKIQA